MMNRFFPPAVLLILLLAGHSAFSEPATRAPAQAAASGFNRLDFNEDFSKFDLSPNGKGKHNWYEGLWYENSEPPQSQITVRDSVLTILCRQDQHSWTSVTTYAHDLSQGRAWRHG